MISIFRNALLPSPLLPPENVSIIPAPSSPATTSCQAVILNSGLGNYTLQFDDINTNVFFTLNIFI